MTVTFQQFAEFNYHVATVPNLSSLYDFPAKKRPRKMELELTAEKIIGIAGKNILTISNLEKKGSMYPLYFLSDDKTPVYLIAEENPRAGSGLSIGDEVIKPSSLTKENFYKLLIRKGTVVESKSFETDPNSLFLTVDFGKIGNQVISLCDTDTSRVWEGKSIVALTNLVKECYLDSSLVPLCFKNEKGENIPFSLSGLVANGMPCLI